MTRRLLVILALALASMSMGTSAALAADAKTSLPDVEDEVMCVSCNVPLNIAESPQAYRQREYIRTLVDDGLSKAAIKDKLVAEYGKNVLAMPDESDGIGLAAYLVPIAVVLALVAAAAFLLPRWRRRAPQAMPATAGAQVSDAELKRLDDDLRRFE